jgi:hypothetical protein
MRIKDMINLSRRVLFENALEGYEYSGRGNCFLCRFRGTKFVIAVRHVIDAYAADAVRVRVHQAVRDFVPHNGLIRIKGTDNKGKTTTGAFFRSFLRSAHCIWARTSKSALSALLCKQSSNLSPLFNGPHRHE